MRITKIAILAVLFLILILSTTLFAADDGADKEIQKTFGPKEEVRIKLALGDCRIEKSSDGQIHVHIVYSYEDDVFEPKLEGREKVLNLQEKFRGNNPRGYSRWTVAVPDKTEIDLSSGTGDLAINGLTLKIEGNTGTGDIQIDNAKGDFEAHTGTGSVYVTNAEGDFDLKSGTGRVRVGNSKGNFDVASGTGSVEAKGLTIESEGEFSSGTGDVEVAFPKGDNFDLTVSSGTDNAVVDMQGSPIQGYFEFTAQAARGRIVSPVKFDKEEEFMEGDHRYLLKSFTKGKQTPKVYIKTGTGTARLKE